MHHLSRLLCAFSFCLMSSAMAQQPNVQTASSQPRSSASAPDAVRAINLQQVTVSGALPGPGLWKVSKADHVLWILGTLTPLPKNMQWEAREVRDDLAQADQVLASPTLNMDADIGFFGKLALLPSLIGVRNNPDGRKLQGLMPAAEYARWLALKSKYIGHNNGVEKQRPIFAAITLYFAAIKQAELADNVIDPVIKDALKQRRMKATPVAFTIEVSDPHALIKDFKQQQMSDMDCFDKTLDHLEGDVGVMRERANAWAMGDLDRLRELPMSNQVDVCIAAITESGIAHKLGVTDLPEKIKTTWLSAATTALDTHRVTFALLPVRDLLGTRNYFEALRQRGYRVEPPEGWTGDAAEAPATP